MSQTTFIDTNSLPRQAMPGGGEMTEILSDALVGAKNVHGTLRWLRSGDTFDAPASTTHQLLYLMDGEGTITLEGKTHAVKKGMGVYLGPSETATLAGGSGAGLKIFHLEVPRIPK